MGHWPISFQEILDFQISQIFGVLPRALSWEQYLTYARLVQGESLRLGFEAFRRNKHGTSGALMWCLAGVWPSADWSIIDYEGVPKPAYYFVKCALAPSLVSLVRNGTGYEAWVVNDHPQPVRVTLHLEYGHLHSGPVWEKEQELAVPTDTAILACILPWQELPIHDLHQEYMMASLWSQGECISRSYLLPASIRDALLPQARLAVTVVRSAPEAVTLQISAQTFAYAIRLDCYGALFEDNYFHLAPGETRKIEVDLRGARSRQLSVSALNITQPLLLEL
jgi:beta-mannosidase